MREEEELEAEDSLAPCWLPLLPVVITILVLDPEDEEEPGDWERSSRARVSEIGSSFIASGGICFWRGAPRLVASRSTAVLVFVAPPLFDWPSLTGVVVMAPLARLV